MLPTSKALLDAKLAGQKKRAEGLRERHAHDSRSRAMCDNVILKVRASAQLLREPTPENRRQVEAFVVENGNLLDEVEDFGAS